jgi:integrase
MRPLTRDVLEQLIATCSKGTLADQRDAALLLLAFASGGRRRSEIAGLRIEGLVDRPPIPADPGAPQGPKLPVLALRLGRTTTASREEDERVLAIGRPVETLRAWLGAAGISAGPVFRTIDRW